MLAVFLLSYCHEEKKVSSINKYPDVIESVHFRFYFPPGEAARQETIDSVENNYHRILHDLAIDTVTKVNFFFYISQPDLRENVKSFYTDLPSFALGFSRNKSSVYMVSPNSGANGYSYQDLIKAAIHEFAHCVSLYVNPDFANNPRWLWESVALYEARQFHDPHSLPYMVSHIPPILKELNNMADKRIYQTGYLIADFILEKWGRKKWVELIKNNGTLMKILHITPGEFEAKWMEYVKLKYNL